MNASAVRQDDTAAGGVILAAQGVSRIFGGDRSLFGGRSAAVHAVQDVSLDLFRGETLGIVGESGCGKSTLARLLVGLDTPTAGNIAIRGEPVLSLDRRAQAQRIQYVFQDPVSSLNPRHTIRQILERPLRLLRGLDGDKRERALAELLEAVNLEPDYLERYPHEFSGGQAQRIGIARALAAEAEILVLDEPVSALDVSVQAQILDLLADLKLRFGLTYVFISHDLAVVEAVSDRVAVMYFGRIVETARRDDLFAAPRHPYTGLLIDSVPKLGSEGFASRPDSGELPDPTNPPPGCAFAARCPNAQDRCTSQRPALEPHAPEHLAACHFPLVPRDTQSPT
ncbi:MAG TPA: oligopeptide/dipeptide ABC transporter ATP-binding protein [Devosiaceae bacterium]